MQFLLEAWPGIQGASMDVGQIRRLIREVFPDADVRHRWQTECCEQVTIDGKFALLRNGTPRWSLHTVVEESTVPPSTVLSQIGDFRTGQLAVRRLVVLMATARVEAAIGKAVQS
jgi:hypothetical protein